MRVSGMNVCGLAAVIFTLSVASSPITLSRGSEHTSTALEVRSSGGVALHFDQKDLVKRAYNVSVVIASLGLSGVAFASACSGFIAVSAAAGAGVCGAGAVVLGLAILWANWAAPASTKRDATISDPRYWGNVVLNFEPTSNSSNTRVMAAMYDGGAPVHVGYTDCEYQGCYNLFYSNYYHAGIGKIVHKISQRPRGDWERTTKANGNSKRQTDEMASNSGNPETESDGTAVYADYAYWDEDATDEMAIHNGESATDLQDSVYTSLVNQNALQNTGTYCMSLIDESDSGAVDSTGYVTISEGGIEQDPDNEATYLEECYDDQFAKRRRA